VLFLRVVFRLICVFMLPPFDFSKNRKPSSKAARGDKDDVLNACKLHTFILCVEWRHVVFSLITKMHLSISHSSNIVGIRSSEAGVGCFRER
jgi:hypothetical protein